MICEPDNLRDILRLNTHGTGVKKAGKKYSAQIRIMCPKLNSTVLISIDAAADLYQALVHNVPHFIRLFKAEGVFNTGKELGLFIKQDIYHLANKSETLPFVEQEQEQSREAQSKQLSFHHMLNRV